MAVKLKTWVWVLLGIASVCVLLIVAMAGFGVYYFTQNIQTMKATPAVATQEFDTVRQRFQGRTPLIELDGEGNVLRSRADRQPAAGAPPPESLRVMAFDPDDGGLVKVTIPFWLLRLKVNDATVNFGGNNLTLEDLNLTVQELERLGPTLVLDQTTSGGDRVLVWSQ